MKTGLEAIIYSFRTGHKIYYKGEPVVARCFTREDDYIKVELAWLNYWKPIKGIEYVSGVGKERYCYGDIIENIIKKEYIDKDNLKNFKTERDMQKQDLKTGMLVQFSNRNIGLVINNFIVGHENDRSFYLPLESLDNNLRGITIDSLDIIKVSNVLTEIDLVPKYWSYRTLKKELLWERKENETKELTLEEIAKKFDISVEQLRIKDK